VVVLALRSGTPILPIAHWGVEDFSDNLKKLRRTDFHVRVGNPFRLEPGGEKVDAAVRQEMVDEIMLQIAALMPEEYHGEYAGRMKNPRYIRWL
jgi:1-acyl-sn-glycerol-3-phosphate acyltransferase